MEIEIKCTISVEACETLHCCVSSLQSLFFHGEKDTFCASISYTEIGQPENCEGKSDYWPPAVFHIIWFFSVDKGVNTFVNNFSSQGTSER